jgi:drug/metabolite transporter (DMT)-like permease
MILMILATSFWGAAHAGISRVGAAGTAGALVTAGGAVALLVFAVARGSDPWLEFRGAPRVFVCLGVLEALNMVCFVAALRIGPLPVVVALHLTAPVLMIITQIARRRRAVTITVAVELAAVAVAIWLVARRHPADSALAPTLIGCILAVGSAACVAGLITIVARESVGRPSASAAGLQLAAAAVLGTPLLGLAAFTGTGPSAGQSVALTLIGALLLGPGFAIYWLALRELDAVTAGLLGLNEAVMATVIGAVVVGTDITIETLMAATLVLGAVGLEARASEKRPLRVAREYRP